MRKKGILIIIAGICIPLFALPFVSGFDINKGFMDNFYNTGIRITKDTANSSRALEKKAPDPSKPFQTIKNMRLEKIPFRLFFVPAVFLIYIGIVMIDRARARKEPKA
ncbi:MAG: hypothetical protein ACYDHW_10160 [Syntrophorhabdaceae bacterium]